MNIKIHKLFWTSAFCQSYKWQISSLWFIFSLLCGVIFEEQKFLILMEIILSIFLYSLHLCVLYEKSCHIPKVWRAFQKPRRLAFHSWACLLWSKCLMLDRGPVSFCPSTLHWKAHFPWGSWTWLCVGALGSALCVSLSRFRACRIPWASW